MYIHKSRHLLSTYDEPDHTSVPSSIPFTSNTNRVICVIIIPILYMKEQVWIIKQLAQGHAVGILFLSRTPKTILAAWDFLLIFKHSHFYLFLIPYLLTPVDNMDAHEVSFSSMLIFIFACHIRLKQVKKVLSVELISPRIFSKIKTSIWNRFIISLSKKLKLMQKWEKRGGNPGGLELVSNTPLLRSCRRVVPRFRGTQVWPQWILQKECNKEAIGFYFLVA